jgi:hypothetical protein
MRDPDLRAVALAYLGFEQLPAPAMERVMAGVVRARSPREKW